MRLLILTRPFRMFTGSLTEEVTQLHEEIEAVKDKVDDPVMCDKVRQFVYASPEIQEMFKADSGKLLDVFDLYPYHRLFVFDSCRKDEHICGHSSIWGTAGAFEASNA